MAPSAIQTEAASPAAQKTSSYIPRGDVTATLNFHQLPLDGSQAFFYPEKQPDGQPQKNYDTNSVAVPIHDIRNSESDFNLDKDAFQAVSGVSSAMSEEDWTNDETIKRVYYPEVENLILDKVHGSYKVTIFDHTVRHAVNNAYREPVQQVHVDQTSRSAAWRVKLHDPEEADTLLEGRYRIINVWRSIGGPVESFPLAFASADTVDPNDLRPVERRSPNRTGETAGVLYNHGQKFHFWSGMDNNERLFLKCSDTREGVGKSVPHSAFVDHRTPEGAKRRASIEVRCLVYG